ncbi:MAG TPA: DUF1553 domain-containing protein, partial [Candidatus Acidoferrum sp.]|nr:DUF1553 domain-containing protein [Candidatus Acidoferrum sp.]
TKYAFPGIELLKVQKDFVPLVSKEEHERILQPFREKERELQKRHDELASKRKSLEDEKAKLDKKIKSAPETERAALTEQNQELYLQIEDVRKKVRTASEALEKHTKSTPAVPDAYAVQDGKPADARIQIKGDPDRKGDVAPRKFLDLLGGQRLNATNQSGRLELANWIADAKNPLTPRVIVNRVWHYHFGAGLVRTPSDFGTRGLPPSHPELLDHLALRFMDGGWSLKKLHREILLSRTYQMSSDDNEAALEADPDNTLLWRVNRLRLDAESLRDTLMFVSGTLDLTPMNEAHPFPPQNKWEFTQHHPFKDVYTSRHRSVYLMSKRLTALPYLQTFDGADPNANTSARDSSVTPLQALYFMNNEFVHEQAGKFAERIVKTKQDDRARLDWAFEMALGRPPSREERKRVEQFLAQPRVVKVNSKSDEATLAQWTSVARVLFRMNEFLYLD